MSDNSIDSTPAAAAAPDNTGQSGEPRPVTFKPGDKVRFRGEDLGEITGVHDDGTYDVQVHNKDGSIKRTALGEPLWYERRPASEFEAF